MSKHVILSRGRKPKREILLEELAKEDTQILALAYAHARYLMMYGVDIEKTVYTATENVASLESSYQQGYYEGMKIKPINKTAMLYDIYMLGVNMTGDYQGCWVRFKNIEEVVNKYIVE